MPRKLVKREKGIFEKEVGSWANLVDPLPSTGASDVEKVGRRGDALKLWISFVAADAPPRRQASSEHEETRVSSSNYRHTGVALVH